MYVNHSVQHLTYGKPLVNGSRYHHLITSYYKYAHLTSHSCPRARLYHCVAGPAVWVWGKQNTTVVYLAAEYFTTVWILASVPCSTRLDSLAPRACLNHPQISQSHALWFEMAGCLHRAASVTRLFFPALASYCLYWSHLSIRRSSAVNNRKANTKSVP